MKKVSRNLASAWTIGKARSNFAGVLKAAERGPQEIYNRKRLQAVVIGPADYRKGILPPVKAVPNNIYEAFAEVREIARVTGWRFPRLPKRRNRPNALLKQLTGRSR